MSPEILAPPVSADHTRTSCSRGTGCSQRACKGRRKGQRHSFRQRSARRWLCRALRPGTATHLTLPVVMVACPSVKLQTRWIGRGRMRLAWASSFGPEGATEAAKSRADFGGDPFFSSRAPILLHTIGPGCPAPRPKHSARTRLKVTRQQNRQQCPERSRP